jgi:hypothetical protein
MEPAHSGPWPLIQFRNHYSQTIGLLGRVISPSQGLYLNTGQHKHRINAYTHRTSMPWVAFEPTIPTSERAKTVDTLDGAATVTDLRQISPIEIHTPIFLWSNLNFIRSFKTARSVPRLCVRFRYMLFLSPWGVFSPLACEAGGAPIVCYPWLLIQCIHSSSPSPSTVWVRAMPWQWAPPKFADNIILPRVSDWTRGLN